MARGSGSPSRVERVDLLERAALSGDVDRVREAYEAHAPFAYRGWALALALRCGHAEVARYLLEQGVDLLEDPEVASGVGEVERLESSLARFDLTRSSANLLLDASFHSVCSEVFAPFSEGEQLVGGPLEGRADPWEAARLVLGLVQEGIFDSVVIDDLFRAAMAEADECLRHPARREGADQATRACLWFASELYRLHREVGYGSNYLRLLLGGHVRPGARDEICAFVCDVAPDVFLSRLEAMSWLQRDEALVRGLVAHLSPGTERQNGILLEVLAKAGAMRELATVGAWERTLTRQNVSRAVDAAARAGRTEAALWLVAHMPRQEGGMALGDLLL